MDDPEGADLDGELVLADVVGPIAAEEIDLQSRVYRRTQFHRYSKIGHTWGSEHHLHHLVVSKG